MSQNKTTTRRDFVKTSAAVSAAMTVGMAAPTIVPSSVFGKDAPSNRITMGFIGIGKQSSGHLSHFAGRPDCQVLAVCDVHKGRMGAAKKTVLDKNKKLERKGDVAAYGDFRELIARKDIQAVVIGTPDHWHTIPIIEAAKTKKDMYCEKPLTLTIHEAKTVIDVVRKHNVVFQTGSQQRSEHHERSSNVGKHLHGIPRFRAAAEYVRSGRLGEITEVHVGIGQTSKPCDLPESKAPDGINWDMWLGQAPQRGWNDVLCRNALPNKYPFNPGWRDYREFSGGHVTDWGAHHFDITQWALGMDESGPIEVIPPEKKGDVYNAQLIYENTPVGKKIIVTHKKGYNGIWFIGSKGKLFVNRGELKTEPGDILATPLTDKDVHLYENGGHRENWIDCIRSRKKPICHEEVGARSVTVCHLANIAYWHHEAFKWDPKKWQFADGTGNPKWIDRDRREKWQLPSLV